VYFFLFNFLNFWLSVAGLVILLITIGLFVDFYRFDSRYYTHYIKRYVWPIIMLTTAGSVAMSLVYSEYFGFIPCSLCWLQRITIYPQALLSIMAFKAKDGVFFPLYGIGLSTFGLIVAIYQYIYQMLPQDTSASLMPCLADGTADCAAKVINQFGFVTFPLLSAITFAFLIVLYLNMRRSLKSAAQTLQH
jgi:disulfide bond formation protein DsbB